MGTGHVMRCLALAQAWKDTGRNVVFVSNMKSPRLLHRLNSEQIEVIKLDKVPGSLDDAKFVANLANDLGLNWIVLDGYHFGSAYQKMIKDYGLNLLFIDDNGHSDHYYADIILNQNLHADERLYRKRETYTRLLLGTKYILLRREFLRWQGLKRDNFGDPHNILVTLGGSDPFNVTLRVIDALDMLNNDLESIVISGASNPHYRDLLNKIKKTKSNIKLESDVQDISKIMAWAHVAVSAGGTTSWELAFMGLPSCIVVIAENQCNIAKLLNDRGISICLGWHENISPLIISKGIYKLILSKADLSSMIDRGRDAVDGKGAMRVVSAIEDIEK
jgi:UDP-2,4-diacetamido-2,4,6-trideoxy-beta-L-altropyranose hydrolase